MADKLIKGARLSNRQVLGLIRLFVLEVPAFKAAGQLKIHRHSAERVYYRIRLALARACGEQALLGGEVEVDESYFGGYRKGKRGRAAAGKVAVFGLLKRQGRVYTRPVSRVNRATLRAIIQQKVPAGSTIYSDGFKSYDGLITDGYQHYRINHDREFARAKHNHINGLENFWGFAKTKLRRYCGIHRPHFFLYLKEMEFRFNHRSSHLQSLILKALRKYPNF